MNYSWLHIPSVIGYPGLTCLNLWSVVMEMVCQLVFVLPAKKENLLHIMSILHDNHASVTFENV